jgi:hypothetical protein
MAFAKSAEAKITGMFEVYRSFIGYVAVNPLYLVDTIGMSTWIPWTYTNSNSIPLVIPKPKILGKLGVGAGGAERNNISAAFPSNPELIRPGISPVNSGKFGTGKGLKILQTIV